MSRNSLHWTVATTSPMPPRLPRLLPLPRPKNPTTRVSYCTSCSLWRTSTPLVLSHPQYRQTSRRARTASTLVSSSAIGASKAQLLEPNVQELFEALDGLKKSAANYVNLSRLQLALQGVEGGTNAGVRVAVPALGNSQPTARRLVRALLADALEKEDGWEKQLEKAELDDGRGLLIRYGEAPSTSGSPNSLLRTLTIPSSLLKKHNLEIVILSLRPGVTQSQTSSLKHVILVPSLETPVSANGRFSIVAYPMHKALIFAQGVEGAITFGRYTAGQTDDDLLSTDLIHVALNIPTSTSQTSETNLSSKISVVDVQLANSAIDKFRQSLGNATIYEQGWSQSNLSSLLKWLLSGCTTTGGQSLKPAVQDLISSLLEDLDSRLASEETRLLTTAQNPRIPPETQASLRSALTLWSERAHTELRDSLDLAFSSRRWRRLQWYKLFWRVDDVSMLAEEVLSRHWLIEAEKEIIWVAGRIEESELDALSRSGRHLLTSQSTTNNPEDNINPETGLPRTFLDAPPIATFSEVLTQPHGADEDEPPLPALRPWPMNIPIQRAYLIAASVPALQARAQSLLFQCLSTSSLSSILAGLVYLSSFSLYESGAVAAVGIVWSLRRLQKTWGCARKAWEREVRQEGASAIRGTERDVREFMEDREARKDPLEGQEERRAAREGLEKAREALKSVVGK